MGLIFLEAGFEYLELGLYRNVFFGFVSERKLDRFILFVRVVVGRVVFCFCGVEFGFIGSGFVIGIGFVIVIAFFYKVS